MIQVSPSILSADFANLEKEITVITRSGADFVHVDVMDGQFVPNISVGIPVVAALSRISPLPLDVHLMIDRPGRYVEDFCKAGAGILTVHLEADTPENIREALVNIRRFGVRAALSIKPATPAEAVLPYLSLCDMILVMTVEPGFSGQKFMADMMPKVASVAGYIRDLGRSCLLEVDGGVSAATCQVCKDNGADLLVAGSAFFKSEDRAAFVRTLKA